MDIHVQQKDVLALIGQQAVEKLALQMQLDAAKAEIGRLTVALEMKEKPNG